VFGTGAVLAVSHLTAVRRT